MPQASSSVEKHLLAIQDMQAKNAQLHEQFLSNQAESQKIFYEVLKMYQGQAPEAPVAEIPYQEPSTPAYIDEPEFQVAEPELPIEKVEVPVAPQRNEAPVAVTPSQTVSQPGHSPSEKVLAIVA